MLLQAALNGPFTKVDHPAMPVSVDELSRDAAACVAAGAQALHIHPRDAHGHERLDADVVDSVVMAVREHCGVSVGVSTGAWIEPDIGRRLNLIRAWRGPDYASVNVCEPGAPEVMRALLDVGIGIEAGVWSVADVERLAATGVGAQVMRILVEPVALSEENAIEVIEAIHAALDDAVLSAPRLQHGDGKATWLLLSDAIKRGLDTRIGLEDTFYETNGERTSGNEALIREAPRLGAGTMTKSGP